MLSGLYSVRDRVACEFGPVQHCKNDAVAVRMFRAALEKASRPDEYELFQVGEMDTDSGNVSGFLRQIPIVVEGYVEDDQNGKA